MCEVYIYFLSFFKFRLIKKINFLFCDNNSIRYLIYVILYFLLPKLSVIVTEKLQNMYEVLYLYFIFKENGYANSEVLFSMSSKMSQVL